ncbi:FixH family protein [Alkalibacillus salilacus]|uniref:YtkA-like domain-containing protein n=1 Tax=Alkalibacillus salilacus TaxID=284582 RepID=A0ABT9VEM0_9BACI|nr:FixH family protein [Alkalibacillus salilacus]MDQ0159416.1 hypothetical protein [Alkalibacillus salilacus]
MSKQLISLMAIILIILSACGNEETEESSEPDSLAPLEVEILTEQNVSKGDVTLSAHVTHDGNNVNEADEVEFEVWQEGSKEESDMIEGSFTEEGVYEANYTFEEDAVYHMIAHVTAVDQHTMPQQALAVGEAELDEDQSNEESHDEDHSDHN